eukprot:CAMPEP_0197025748 /NCGR_PEP_ID=MMETSP1384-20130603/5982_1 /TAXON_ID=29189 /ORGANISM="Ammonia sp." /LENGTH=150 /DNA_ID=CAMNT_0042454319 /DNA_START=144 /DNA_END=596 /DNA_ORIENTATION=-
MVQFKRCKVAFYWSESDSICVLVPMSVTNLIWHYLQADRAEMSINLALWSVCRRGMMSFDGFLEAGRYYKRYCQSLKWKQKRRHKQLGSCAVGQHRSVCVYDYSNKQSDDGYILFHFGVQELRVTNGCYEYDYTSRGVYYYVKYDDFIEV